MSYLSKSTLKLSGIIIMFTLCYAKGIDSTLCQGQTVDSLVTSYMAKNNIPGLSLTIVQAPSLSRVVGYGLADVRAKRLTSTNTVFAIGQLTRVFTAIAIMQLKEEGKLTLDDLITQYIKSIPEEWSSISIYNLLTHTSGLSSYTDARSFDYSKEYMLTDIINLVKDQKLLFKPGTSAIVSATNYYLLGAIIEKASGMTYQKYVTKNQIERVGLKHTSFISNDQAHSNKQLSMRSQFLHNPAFINPTELAVGYTRTDEELIPSTICTWSATFSDSGIISSSQDMSLWDLALAGDILVKEPQNRAFLYNPCVLKNGEMLPGNAGWFFPGHKGLMEIKGNIPGYSSFLSRFTDSSELVCVTLLVNKDGVQDLDILGRKIANVFNDRLGAPQGSAWSVTMQSPYSVEKTIDRIAQTVKTHGGTIFAHIDHAQEAAKVGQSLQPTQVLILGNPAQGTAMMQSNPAMALDLPLRVMATQDSAGQTWLSFTDPIALAKEYGTYDQKHLEHLKKIYNALLGACQKAISL